MIAWSYGGGVQSVAIGVLIRQGRLPKPELAVIVDTGRERRTTWDYLHNHLQPFLDPVGLTIQIASHERARKDLFAVDGTTIIPAFTEEGRLGTFCSGTWKRDVFEGWLREQGVKECTCWIGYSIDELWRVNAKDHRPWCKFDFPLINLWINRAMCQTIIKEAGLPIPSKSRCYCCPHQNAEEWREVRNDPVEWPLALAVEEQINASDPEQAGLFLHKSRVPLALVDFGRQEDGTVGRPCDSGHCWT